jgi:DNA invertase Pin-like site-specific DNA recombinase
MKKKVVIYTRVSKLIQDYERQINELLEYANKRGYKVVKVISEKISGGKRNDERKGIIELMGLIEGGKIDKVLVWELSRLGRNSFEVHKIINTLNEKKVSLYVKNYDLETLDAKGEIKPMAKFMIMILSEFAENERLNIKQRLQSGYKQYRDGGGKVGRKTGAKENQEQFLEKHKDIQKLLKKEMSIRNVATLTGKSTKTVQKVKKFIEVQN